ncbi:MAG: ATP-binding protein, partial [Hyphomicrobiaceae bacterium]
MFQPSKAIASANQLASLLMSDTRARSQRIAADDPLAALRGGGGYATILSVLVAAGAVVMSLIASDYPNPLLVALLATLAMLGVFLLFGMAAGHIRMGDRLPEADLVKLLVDTDDIGVLVTRQRGGDPIYANAAVSRLVGRSDSGSLGTLEEAFAAVREASEAIFRLSRAAAQGQTSSEVVPATPRAALSKGETQRYLRISVKSFVAPAIDRDPGPLIVWTFEDVTEERRAAARQRQAYDKDLALYDGMPLGLMTVDADGIVTHANATLTGWIGYGADVIQERVLRLSDLVSDDGVELLRRAGREGDGAALSIDLDMTREDGRLLPMHLVCRADASQSGSLVIGGFNRENETFGDDDGGAADQRFSRFFQSAPFGIATLAPNGRIANANAAFARMILDGTSAAAEPALDVLTRQCDASVKAEVARGLDEVLAGRGNVSPIDVTFGAGKDYTRRVFMSPLAGARDAREAAVLYVLDATEQKRLEARFAQSSKMEAVGTLAGGIAHDFNNALTSIIGFSEFLLQAHQPPDPSHRDLMLIKSEASRAAGLVSKLMAFSRLQTLQNEMLQLGDVVSDLMPLLSNALGERVKLKVQTERELWFVKTDKTQLDRVIVNLAVNARDAMADGGTLTIRTRNVTERECHKLDHFGLKIGEYVLVEVEDTGCGMSAEVLNKIFEPFFTTKGVGKGTGLGLATVYGIVKQSGGFIFPESEVGKG